MRKDDSGCFLGAFIFVWFFSKLKNLFSKGRTWCIIGVVVGVFFVCYAFTDKFLPSPLFTLLLGVGLIVLSLLPIIRNWWNNMESSGESRFRHEEVEEEFTPFRFDDTEDFDDTDN